MPKLSNYDAIDAAYIAQALFKLTDSDHRVRGAGELEDMGAMFRASIEAAQIIHALVHPDEYDRLAVFCYEVDWNDLAKRMVARGCRDTKAAVVEWMRAHSIRAIGPVPAGGRPPVGAAVH